MNKKIYGSLTNTEISQGDDMIHDPVQRDASDRAVLQIDNDSSQRHKGEFTENELHSLITLFSCAACVVLALESLK